jgi:MFS transporter, AAHS family, 3-hydroxyphenylpropionic acid transporter
LSRALQVPRAAVATLVCCTLAAMCEGIDIQAAGVAAAGIVAEFRPAPSQLGNFFSASTLGLFFGALLGGRLSDAVGRKAVLVSSIALFGVCSLLTCAAWDFNSLYWSRLLTGLGLGGALPNLIALVNEASPARRRLANVGLVYAGTPLGGAIASSISLLSASSHWRWIFIAGGVAPLLLAAAMSVLLPESPAFERQRAIAPHAAREGSPVTVTDKTGFLAILSQGRATRTVLLWVSFFLGLLTLFLLLNWLPTLLVASGLSKAQAASAQIGFNVGGSLAALLMGFLLEGRLRSASIIAIFLALPLLLLWLGLMPPAVAMTLLAVFLLGCAILAAQTFLYAIAPACYPAAIRGVGVGVAVAAGRIGSIAGPALGGVLKGMGHSSSQLMLDLLPIAIAGSFSALLLAWIIRNHGAVRPPVPAAYG